MADRLLAAQRIELAGRNRLAQRLLDGRSAGFPHGLHRWLLLPPGTDERALLDRALDRGVAVAPGSGFAVTDRDPALRICLGAAPLREMELGLSINDVNSILTTTDNNQEEENEDLEPHRR